MFDLERELQKWRREMAATGLAPEILIELEEHLREDVERQVLSGTGVSEALHVALQRIGQPDALRNEFNLIRQPGIAGTLRQHKWKILLCSGAGLLAAIVLHVLRPAPYQSETKILIRYMAADGQLLAPGFDQRIAIVPDRTLERIMHEQLEILTSLDLAQRVAEKMGPNKILKKAGGGEDLARATAVVKYGLRVTVPANSSVIQIAFRHPDSAVVQGVLREVLDGFRRMHVEVYRSTGDRAVAIGRVTNISLIQPPSPPAFDFAALFRLQTMVLIAGVVAGFVWVLVIRLSGVRLKLAD